MKKRGICLVFSCIDDVFLEALKGLPESGRVGAMGDGVVKGLFRGPGFPLGFAPPDLALRLARSSSISRFHEPAGIGAPARMATVAAQFARCMARVPSPSAT